MYLCTAKLKKTHTVDEKVFYYTILVLHGGWLGATTSSYNKVDAGITL